MPHYFSIDEANSALNEIRPLVDEILSIRKDILAKKPEAWPIVEKAAGNGGSKTASRIAMDFERLDRLVHRILDAGVLIKDINTGLLDFPAWRGDHEVYLCWKFDEEKIFFWHEIDAGFAGRQPIGTF